MVNIFIEIEFTNGTTEKYEVDKIIKSTKDIKLRKSGENKIELFNRFDDRYYLSERVDGQYMWINAYLKGSKSHQNVRIRRAE